LRLGNEYDPCSRFTGFGASATPTAGGWRGVLEE
jgi:hypothetical protein